MDKKVVKKYFRENALSWVKDGYGNDGWNYPIGYHRRRIILKILSQDRQLKIVDFGCGGGNLAIELAKKGHIVTGVDESPEMVKIAEENRRKLLPEIQQRITFVHMPLQDNGFAENSFDVVVAMGVIGYFSTDDILFKAAGSLLKPGGLFLVSCRNRLFNMISMTHRTRKEIESKEAIKLIAEINDLHERVSCEDASNLIIRLKKSVQELPDKALYEVDTMAPSGKKRKVAYTMDIEARQHTPKELIKSGKNFGFEHKAYFGIHPHIIAPTVNRFLPPKIFDKISECLETLEHLPISLIWSSVFLGVFKKET